MGQADRTRTVLAALVTAGLLAGGAALSSAGLLAAIALVQAALIVTWSLAAAPPGPVPVLAAVTAAAEGRHYATDEASGPLVERVDDYPVAAFPGSAPGRAPGAAYPGRIGALVIGGLAAASADTAVSAWPDSALSPVLSVLGLVVPLMFVHQLVRGVVRVRVVESLSGISIIVAGVVAVTALAQLRHEPDGATLVIAAVVAIGVAAAVAGLADLVWARPRYDPDVERGFTATLVGGAAGAGAGAYALRSVAEFPTGRAVLLCAVLAAVSALTSVAAGFVAHGLATSPTGAGVRVMRTVAVAVVPFTLIAPVAYVVLVGGG